MSVEEMVERQKEMKAALKDARTLSKKHPYNREFLKNIQKLVDGRQLVVDDFVNGIYKFPGIKQTKQDSDNKSTEDVIDKTYGRLSPDSQQQFDGHSDSDKRKAMSGLIEEADNPVSSGTRRKTGAPHNTPVKQGKGLKLMSPGQMLQRLPIALAQVKAGNNSIGLQNEIRQILYALVRAGKITKKVYENLMRQI